MDQLPDLENVYFVPKVDDSNEFSIHESIYITYQDDPNKISLTIEAFPIGSSSQQVITKKKAQSRTELRVFFSFRTKNNRPPKKEYLRVGIIRSLKRSIREALDSKIPIYKLHAVNINNVSSLDIWNAYANICRENRALLEEISKTESGPLTDGVKKKVLKKSQANKSHNNNFCLEFFKKPLVKGIYSMFIDVVFADASCKILEKKFGLSAHFGKQTVAYSKWCNEKCMENWHTFENYLRKDMLADIGVHVEDDEIIGSDFN